MTGSEADEARGSTAGLLDGRGRPGGLAGRWGCSFPSCCSKQGKQTEEARCRAALGDAAGQRGWKVPTQKRKEGGTRGRSRGREGIEWREIGIERQERERRPGTGGAGGKEMGIDRGSIGLGLDRGCGWA